MKPTKPEEIQKEFEEFARKRFGEDIEVLSESDFMMNSKETPEQEKISENNKEILDELSFKYTPKQIKEHLDRFVVGQDEAKKAISIALCDHYNQVKRHKEKPEATEEDNYTKQNLLVLGSTGVGKTYMIKQAAKLIGVPFVKADATRFSETGYMGANVDDLIKDLASQASGDLSKAQYGIIYLDEVDKLAGQNGNSGKDVSGRGVQLGLLKLMEETDVDLRAGNDPASQIQAFMELQRKGKVDKQVINTKYILFIASGAFTGLEKIIEKRLHQNTIGFQPIPEEEKEEKNTFSEASTEDFIKFGLEPEFIGRLPVRVACHNLDTEVLYNILKSSEGSILKQYKTSFEAHGIEASFEDDAIWEIANRASSEKTGARGLSTICETFLRGFKFELPSTNITKLSITKSLIQNPHKHLAELLESAQEKLPENLMKEIQEFSQDFESLYGVSLNFTDKAMRLIEKKSEERKESPITVCEKTLLSYGHGLKLIKEKTGKESFTITQSIIENPKEELEKIFQKSLQPS